MTDRRRPRILLALLVLATLVLITLDFREGDDGPLSELQQAAFGAFAPLQDAVASLTRPVGNFLSGLGDLGERRQRIERLEQELEQVRQQRLSVADLERENAELRELLDMRERREFTTRTSRVIAQPPGGSRWSALIDVGANDGVEPDMAVINADGLVGKVIQVAPEYARIELAASPRARYAVRLTRNGEQALLSGRGQRPMELQLIEDTEAEFEAGTEVVTRAFQGTRIPDGLPVGALAQGGSGDRTPTFAVTPAVDFSSLDLVMVVVDTPEIPVELDPSGDDPDPEDPDAAPDPPGAGAADPEANGDDPGADLEADEGNAAVTPWVAAHPHVRG